MQGLVDDVQAHVLRIHIRLFACRERLVGATDNEALHDLRIALRQLRSLLRPLASIAICADLQHRASALGKATGPLRDLEVLVQYLQQQGLSSVAHARLIRLQQGYADLLDSELLGQLLSHLDAWPQLWQEAAGSAELRKLIKQRLRKDCRQLAHALQDPAHDRHRLRLLVKRMRYAAEAYPQLSVLSGRALAQLKKVQSALGDWHDHWQWLQRAETEVDLQVCVPSWRDAMQCAEQKADLALQRLAVEFARVKG